MESRWSIYFSIRLILLYQTDLYFYQYEFVLPTWPIHPRACILVTVFKALPYPQCNGRSSEHLHLLRLTLVFFSKNQTICLTMWCWNFCLFGCRSEYNFHVQTAWSSGQHSGFALITTHLLCIASIVPKVWTQISQLEPLCGHSPTRNQPSIEISISRTTLK